MANFPDKIGDRSDDLLKEIQDYCNGINDNYCRDAIADQFVNSWFSESLNYFVGENSEDICNGFSSCDSATKNFFGDSFSDCMEECEAGYNNHTMIPISIYKTARLIYNP